MHYTDSFKIMMSAFPLSEKVARGGKIDTVVSFLQSIWWVPQNLLAFSNILLK